MQRVDREQADLARSFWDIQGIASRFGRKRGQSFHANMGFRAEPSSASYYPDGYAPTVSARVGSEQVTIYKWLGDRGARYTEDGEFTDQIKSLVSRYSSRTSP